MGITSLTGNIVKDYLGRFPKLQSLTLAKKIYNENIEVFSNVEHVRTTIRMYRGKQGNKNRKKVQDKQFFNQVPTLPKSEKENKPTYILPKADNNILLISDLHCPFHDNDAIEAALNYGVSVNVNTIIINGDLVDFYGLSDYEKDPRKVNVNHEIQTAKQVLEYIRYKFPDAHIIYYMGNHDHRFNKYMTRKAPELLDIPEFNFYSIMGLAKLGITFLDNNRGWRAGKLNGRHAHEFQGGGGVYPARNYYLKANDNIIVSHVHTNSEFIVPNIRKELRGGWSVACLSDLDPDYNPNNRYCHGFAHIRVFKDDNFSVDLKKVINGRVHNG